MSKLFKIIVDILIIVCILAVVALIVPSLVGVKTDIAGPKMDTNLQEGTVTYGVRRPVGALLAGDEIVSSGDDYLYVYTVEKVDTDNGEVYAIDQATSETNVLPIKKNAIKKVFAVPYLGYLMIATRSHNGMAMLISAAVVLLALFIVAEVWNRKVRREKVLAYNEEDEDYFNALAQSMEKPGSTDNSRRTAAAAPVETPAMEPAANEEAGMTIMIPDDEKAQVEKPVQELILEPVEEQAEAVNETASFAAEVEKLEEGKQKEEKAAPGITLAEREAIEAYKMKTEASAGKPSAAAPEQYDTDRIVAAFAEIPDDNSAATLDMSDDKLPGVSDALVAALNTTQVSRPERPYQPAQPVVEEPVNEEVDEIELAIPVKTLDELLEEAYTKGYDPLVTTDDVTGVKLVDFSDCL